MPEMRGPQEAPAEERPVYKPGDVVWVKLPAFPWWPAQVVPAEDYPDLLQPMVALVKTFQDNCVIPITKANKIALFEDPRKEDWIKRGQSERRATLQSMFLPAVRQAEEELQEAKMVKEEEMEDQASEGACENCSGVSASPSGVESTPKRQRRGSGRPVGRRRSRKENSQAPRDQSQCTSELLPPPPPPLPPSPPQSDKDFVRHEILVFDFDDLPRITPPTKIRSPLWSRKPQKSELETVSVKALETAGVKALETVGIEEPVSEKDSMQTNEQENHDDECVEISSRADTCEGTAAVGDPATAESVGCSGCPTQALSEFQDEKAAARGGESESSEPGCDMVADEGSDGGGQGVEPNSLSESSSENLSLPVTPTKMASEHPPLDSTCSPVLSNCSEEIPLPISPQEQGKDENVDDKATRKSPSLSSSSSSSSGIISFPNLDQRLKCSSNRTAASSGEAKSEAKCTFTCSTRARNKFLLGNTRKAEETCTSESVEAPAESAQTTSSQAERSPARDPGETPLEAFEDDEPLCGSQSLPLPVTPEKRKRASGKRARPRPYRRVTKKAKPYKATKLGSESNPVEAEGSRDCPVVTSSSSVEDRTDARGRDDGNADSDSESDLPDVLKLSPDEMKYPQEKSVVWVKFQRFPFWPSVVQKVMKVKKRIKKIKVTFLGEGPRSFLVTYTKKNVIYPFSGPHYQKLVDAGREALKDKGEVALKNFNEAVHLAYQHRNAEMYKALNCSELEPMDTETTVDAPAETKADEPDDRRAEAPPKQEKKTAAKRKAPRKRAKTPPRPSSLQKKVAPKRTVAPAGQTSRAKVPKPISRTQQERRQRAMMIRRQQRLNKMIANKAERKKRNKVIVDYIKSEATAEHLKSIFHGKVPSKRHNQYLEGIRQRDSLRYAGFGPIDDEEQQEEILQHLTTIFKQCYHKLGHETYVLDVWVPEAVVLSLQKTRRQAPKRAWDMFRKGVPLLKVEQELIHEEIAANIKRLKSEDPAAEEAVVEIPDN